MNKNLSNIALLVVLGLLVAVLFGTMAVQQTAFATDPTPQSVMQSRSLAWSESGEEYTDDETTWSTSESAFYGIADIYYAVDVMADGILTEVVTVTLQHSPDCLTWKTYGTAASYTDTQAVSAGTVFTRVASYGGCIRAKLEQSDTALTSPVTFTLYTILKNN